MKFEDDGDFLIASTDFMGKPVEVVVEYCNEPQDDLRGKVESAKTGWEENENGVRQFLSKRLERYEAKPDFMTSEISMVSLCLQVTEDEEGETPFTSHLVFEFEIDFSLAEIEAGANCLTPEVIYKLEFPFEGKGLRWDKPILNLDFDSNC